MHYIQLTSGGLMQVAESRYQWNFSYSLKFILSLLLLYSLQFLLTGCTTTNTAPTETINNDPIEIPLLKNWSGDYPVPDLARLPEGQQDVAAGYIGDAVTFIPVWRAFMPEEILPAVDFSKNIVVFSRNVQFYNRISILKVILQNGTVEIIAMETMSAMPMKEKAAMAMVVIPREGIMNIHTGTETIQVMPYQ
jgi:hypothetical protein